MPTLNGSYECERRKCTDAPARQKASIQLIGATDRAGAMPLSALQGAELWLSGAVIGVHGLNSVRELERDLH